MLKRIFVKEAEETISSATQRLMFSGNWLISALHQEFLCAIPLFAFSDNVFNVSTYMTIRSTVHESQDIRGRIQGVGGRLGVSEPRTNSIKLVKPLPYPLPPHLLLSLLLTTTPTCTRVS